MLAVPSDFRSGLTPVRFCRSELTAMHEVRTTCSYCGVGCGVLATTDGKQITAVRGDPITPANFGRLCTKGSTRI